MVAILKTTTAQEIISLKAIIASMLIRIEDLERINFHADWNSKNKLLIKKEKAWTTIGEINACVGENRLNVLLFNAVQCGIVGVKIGVDSYLTAQLIGN